MNKSELITRIDNAEKELEAMRSELNNVEDTHNGLTMSEWSQLAELGDVLVEVSDSDNFDPRYLASISTGRLHPFLFMCWGGGGTSITANGDTTAWRNCRLIEDDRWRLNEGKQPVPDNVEVETLFRAPNSKAKGSAGSIYWKITGSSSDIVAYRIIGVKGD